MKLESVGVVKKFLARQKFNSVWICLRPCWVNLFSVELITYFMILANSFSVFVDVFCSYLHTIIWHWSRKNTYLQIFQQNCFRYLERRQVNVFTQSIHILRYHKITRLVGKYLSNSKANYYKNYKQQLHT